MKFLSKSFYQREDVTGIAQDLLGKILITDIDDHKTGGIIIETEAYGGATDRGCHAFANRVTKRTRTMYETGGIAYIYLCYGMHNMLNVVTNVAGIPEAVLIRAISPKIGIDKMLIRRQKNKQHKNLTEGPGSLCQALSITRHYNGWDLSSSSLWIEDRGLQIQKKDIEKSKRIGIDYAGEDANRLWRFRIKRQIIDDFVKLKI